MNVEESPTVGRSEQALGLAWCRTDLIFSCYSTNSTKRTNLSL